MANRFDSEAQGWDEKPMVKEISKKSASSILTHVPFTDVMDVMDFGCGTGLISESILGKVKSVVGIDAAQGMIDTFNKKIKVLNLKNVSAEYVFLRDGNQLGGRKFDVIYSSFAMHHIDDVAAMLKILNSYLKPGGYLAVVDLIKTENTPLFHAKSKHGDVFHHGFTFDEMINYSKDIKKIENVEDGEWDSINVFDSFSIKKELDDIPGQEMEFGAFILICKKK